MKINYGLLLAPSLVLIFCASSVAQLQSQPALQTRTGSQSSADAQAAPAQASAQPVQPPSSIMQPALDNLQQAIDRLEPQKWKGPGAMRDDAVANINSIRRDLGTTLPSLLNAADAEPNSITKVLPAYRNVEALYDVLLRVDQASRYTAPNDQVAALESAMSRLEASRRALAEQMQMSATTREKQVVDLQAAVKAAAAKPPAPCTPPPTTKKRSRRHTTTKAKSRTTSSGTSSSH